METGKSGVGSEEELIKLLIKYAGEQNIRNDYDLEWDLGLTGDDAIDFLEEYGKVFNVDISKFPFDEYFYDEGQNFILLMCRIFRRYKKKKFTIGNLMIGLEKGILS